MKPARDVDEYVSIPLWVVAAARWGMVIGVALLGVLLFMSFGAYAQSPVATDGPGTIRVATSPDGGGFLLNLGDLTFPGAFYLALRGVMARAADWKPTMRLEHVHTYKRRRTVTPPTPSE